MRHHCLPYAACRKGQSASEAPSPRLSKDLAARRFSSRALGPDVSMPIPPVGTIRSTSRGQARSHPTGELSADRDRRETLYNNIGNLGLVVLQNASRFTGPKHAAVATQIHPRRQLCAGQGVAQALQSAMRGARCRSGAPRCCLLRAGALQPESLGSMLRVSCDLRAHDTRGV